MAYRETANVKARKAAQRDHLLHSAEQLVREGGFANLTMQTLAEEAGVGVGTLYRYFDNKAVLAAEVFRVATEREVAAVATAMEHPGSFTERLAVLDGGCEAEPRSTLKHLRPTAGSQGCNAHFDPQGPWEAIEILFRKINSLNMLDSQNSRQENICVL